MGFLSAFMSPPKVIEEPAKRLVRHGPIKATTRNRYADLMSVARLQFQEPNFDEDFFLAANKIPKFIPSSEWKPLLSDDDPGLLKTRKTQRKRSLAISMITAGVIAGAAVIMAFHTTSKAPQRPAWIRQLVGAEVTAPSGGAVGSTTPQAAVLRFLQAEDGQAPAGMCQFIEPAGQATCLDQLASAPPDSGAKALDYKVGYTVEMGREALVGITGTFCAPNAHPECLTNTDPAAVFSSGRPFAALYAEAVDASAEQSAAYSLTPCVRVGSKWYVYSAPAAA